MTPTESPPLGHPADDQITTPMAAGILCVDVSTLIRWAEAGKVEPLFKMPGLRGAYVWSEQQIRELHRAQS